MPPQPLRTLLPFIIIVNLSDVFYNKSIPTTFMTGNMNLIVDSSGRSANENDGIRMLPKNMFTRTRVLSAQDQQLTELFSWYSLPSWYSASSSAFESGCWCLRYCSTFMLMQQKVVVKKEHYQTVEHLSTAEIHITIEGNILASSTSTSSSSRSTNVIPF